MDFTKYSNVRNIGTDISISYYGPVIVQFAGPNGRAV